MPIGNSILDNNWDWINDNIQNKICLQNRMRLSSIDKKLIVNQIVLSKLWYIGQVYAIPNRIQTNIEKTKYNFLQNDKNIQLVTQSSFPYSTVDFGHKNTMKLMKRFILYRLNLILISHQGLALFGQVQILRSSRHKNLLKSNNEIA